MDHGANKLVYSEQAVPGKVDVPQLQRYFQIKYELDEKQAETLVASSCESLNDLLSEAHSLLTANDEDMGYEPIRGIVHRAKGLFLTMGQEEWAEYATNLKQSVGGKVRSNLQVVVVNIENNFSDIIMLCEE